MSKQLITVRPDGSVQGLDFKEKGMSLVALGKASTRRISEVEWSDQHQMWTVRLLQGTLAGVWLTQKVLVDSLPDYPWQYRRNGWIGATGDIPYRGQSKDGLLLFALYEHAVTAEVFFIQQVRLAGSNSLVSDV